MENQHCITGYGLVKTNSANETREVLRHEKPLEGENDSGEYVTRVRQALKLGLSLHETHQDGKNVVRAGNMYCTPN